MNQIREDERFAFAVTAKVLSAEVEPFDINGRQRAVDAILHFRDGTDAAMEVTSIGPEDEAGILNYLGRTGNCRKVSGISGRWLVDIPRKFHPADVKKIEGALHACEANKVSSLADLFSRDAIATELIGMGVRAMSLSDLPSSGPEKEGRVYFILFPFGGSSGAGLSALPGELRELLNTVKIRAKVDKLIAAGLPNSHLFIIVRPSGFSYPVYDALAFGGKLPTEPPVLPSGLAQIWLVTGIGAGGVVRAVSGRGWLRDNPYENWPKLTA